MKKEFNLEEALKGAKLITRDGREVSEWKYFETLNGVYKCMMIVDGDMYSYREDGRQSIHHETSLDLFILTKPKKCYVNVYQRPDGSIWLGDPYKSIADAKYGITENLNYIKTIEITDEP